MICARCGEETASRPCPWCQGEPLLEGRYRLDAVLGRGAIGTTYAAVAVADGRELAIKEVSLHRIPDEKARAMVEREAAVLQQLSHPAIPRGEGAFLAGQGKHRGVYIVQERIAGQSLEEESRSRRYTPAEVLDIAEELLGVLAYLHGLAPPVIHRDLKPANVMRRPDGRLALIDFGAVRDALKDPSLGGSTVAGTFGYMAPEQFMGDASPATDVYGLGALMVALLARRDPQQMMGLRGLEWRPHVQAHPAIDALLASFLASDPAQRPPGAQAALERLRAARAALERRPAPESQAPAAAPPARRPAPERASEPGNSKLAAVGSVALFVLASLAVGVAGFLSREQDEEMTSASAAPAAEPAPTANVSLALLDPVGAEAQAPAEFAIRFDTTEGAFTMDCRRAWAPHGADRLYNLVKIGFYDDTAFFRAIDGFMVQFGLHGAPAVNRAWKEANIPDDPVTQPNKRGYVSFATAGPETRTTQLFINYADNERLDGMGFAPVCQVDEAGMKVVDALYSDYGEGAPTGSGPNQARIYDQGNAYLKEKFPALDYIKTATVISPPGAGDSEEPRAAPGGEERIPVEVGTYPPRGSASAPVKIVVFSDFQCPFCSRLVDTLDEIQRAYPREVAIYFRDFPLSFHADARGAHLAARCAAEQGRFWEMHDRLFDHQQDLAADELRDHARAVGLNTYGFDACREGDGVRSLAQDRHIEKDIKAGEAAGVTGAPASFVNGRKISGAAPFSAFQAIIDEELGRLR